MKYKFTRKERKRSVIGENLLDKRSYFVPFSGRAACERAEYINARTLSDRVQMLNGEWDFRYFPDGYLSKEPFDPDLGGFSTIKVPDSWENAGFETKAFLYGYGFTAKYPAVPEGNESGNAFGIYRRKFYLRDFTKRYILTFIRVYGDFEVYVNGNFVGSSSLGSGEFEITRYVKDVNDILVTVKKWSLSSYLNGGRRFAATGIVGDVYVTGMPPTSLYDYSFSYDREGENFVGRIGLRFSTDGTPADYSLELEKDGKKEFAVRRKVAENCEYVFEGEYECFTADDPALYDLYIRVIDNERVIECTRVKLGFGYFSELDGVISYCDAPLKIRGVNYNAAHSATGKTMTIADYAKDFELLREYGFNAVQPTYEMDPAAIAVAAEKGLYFIDRIGVDTSGMRNYGAKKRDAVASDSKFAQLIQARTDFWFGRDKSAPNVVAFSFGEENAAKTNIKNAVDSVKANTKRPVFYRSEPYDNGISVLFRPGVDDLIDDINFVAAKRPVFMSEYGLSSGVGSANLAEFTEIIDGTPCCMGGCINYFVDDNADKIGICNDDGLFTADRRPYSGAENHKYLTRSVRCRIPEEDKLEITNLNAVYALQGFLKISILTNGKVESVCEIKLTVAPKSSRVVDVYLGRPEGDKYLNIECTDLNTGKVVASEQLPYHSEMVNIYPIAGKSISVSELYDIIEVHFDGGKVRFSKTSGTIIGYEVKGKEVLMPTSGRLGGGCFYPKITRPFRRNVIAGYKEPEAERNRIEYHIFDDRVEITTDISLKTEGKVRYVVQDKYVVYPNGAVEVFSMLVPRKNCPETMDCFGKQLRLRPCFEDITYYGRGDSDNYLDLFEHTVMGIHRDTASGMGNACAFGQECGNRTGIHYLVARDGEGDGIMISACDAPLQARVSSLSDSELAASFISKQIRRKSGVFIEVDAFVSGYGSGNSSPMAKYTVKSGEHLLQFRILPIYAGEKYDFLLD